MHVICNYLQGILLQNLNRFAIICNCIDKFNFYSADNTAQDISFNLQYITRMYVLKLTK